MSDETEQPLNLDIPEHLEYSDEHVWVDRSDDLAIIGITEYAADQLGELVFVDLPEPGTRVEAGDEIVELESSKPGGRYREIRESRRGGRPVRGEWRSLWRRLDSQG